MVVLWTDALIYLLILVMLALGLYLRGKEHIQRPLQQIGRSKIGMTFRQEFKASFEHFVTVLRC
jgi:hypothetical protein